MFGQRLLESGYKGDWNLYFLLSLCQYHLRREIAGSSSRAEIHGNREAGHERVSIPTSEKVNVKPPFNSTHPLYTTWRCMIWRCISPKHKHWKLYGGRGIKVCQIWRRSFRRFVLDMGPRPKGYELDRWPDRDGDYRPSNCRWATRSQQTRNKSNNHYLTFEGRTMSMWDWADEIGMKPETLLNRIRKGWEVREAILIPVIPGKSIRRVIWNRTETGSLEEIESERKRSARIVSRKCAEARSKRRRDEGLCCRCERSALPGFVVCNKHRLDRLNYQRKYYKEHGLHQGPIGRPRKVAL